MKKFTILEKRELIEYTRYTIQAESEEEVLAMVQEVDYEDVEDCYQWTREIGIGASVEIIEIKNV